ncbi:hypothetical protein N8565_00560, partial [Akkermansiaceae bacterium]|nr:hypothetical protein [Akkermansiaceae bacterium]
MKKLVRIFIALVALGGLVYVIEWPEQVERWKLEKSAVGKWVYLGSPDRGFVLNRDESGLTFGTKTMTRFEWEVGPTAGVIYINLDSSIANPRKSTDWVKMVKVDDRFEIYQPTRGGREEDRWYGGKE